MEDWAPISSAPLDKRILGWDGDEMVTLDWLPPCRIGINKHIEISGMWVQISESGRATVFNPTHWIPLPASPSG